MHLLHQLHRGLEIRIGFAGKAYDEIPRKQQIRARRADPFDQPDIALGGMFAVHCLQNTIGPRLHRQMQIGHQLVTGGMGVDQCLIHVVGMRRGKANPLQPIDLVQRPDQPGQPLLMPVIGIYVLAQQCDFLHAAFHQFARLTNDAISGARYLGTAGVGDHTERAEFVATLLHGQKGGGPTLRPGPGFQGVKLVIIGKISVERSGT